MISVRKLSSTPRNIALARNIWNLNVRCSNSRWPKLTMWALNAAMSFLKPVRSTFSEITWSFWGNK